MAPGLRRHITQAPTAHMTRQGAVDRISGATPIAVSQLQPSVSPEPARASPTIVRTYRLPSQDRSTPRGNLIGENGGPPHPRIVPPPAFTPHSRFALSP